MSAVVPKPTFDPLTPIPVTERPLSGRDAFSLWFSLGVGLLVMQTGAGLVPALGLGPALCIIVIGSAIGVAMLAAASLIGARTGVSAMAGLRTILGRRGATVASGLNALQLVGWAAFELIAMGQVADILCRGAFGWSLPGLWTVLFGLLATVLAVMGPVSFIRRFLRRYGIYLLLGGATWLTWRLLANHDLAALVKVPATGSLSMGSGLDLVIAMPISWLPLVADYSRFGRSPARTAGGGALGFFIANVWFFSLGATYALLGSGGGDILAASLAAAGGGLALLLIVIDETDNVFADIYSAAASSALLVPVSVRNLAMGLGALSTAIALFVPLSSFQEFLFLIGSIFAPLFAVLFMQHFFIAPRRPEIRAEKASFYWRGLVAWGIGVAAYQAIVTTLPSLGATLPAMAVAATVYAVFSLVGTREPAE